MSLPPIDVSDKVTVLHLALSSSVDLGQRISLLVFAFGAAVLHIVLLYTFRYHAASRIHTTTLVAGILWSFFSVIYHFLTGILNLVNRTSIGRIGIVWSLSLLLVMVDMTRPLLLLGLGRFVGKLGGVTRTGFFLVCAALEGLLDFALFVATVWNSAWADTWVGDAPAPLLALLSIKVAAASINLFYQVSITCLCVHRDNRDGRLSRTLLGITFLVVISHVTELVAASMIFWDRLWLDAAPAVGIAFGTRLIYLGLMVLVLADVGKVSSPSQAPSSQRDVPRATRSVAASTRSAAISPAATWPEATSPAATSPEATSPEATSPAAAASSSNAAPVADNNYREPPPRYEDVVAEDPSVAVKTWQGG